MASPVTGIDRDSDLGDGSAACRCGNEPAMPHAAGKARHLRARLLEAGLTLAPFAP